MLKEKIMADIIVIVVIAAIVIAAIAKIVIEKRKGAKCIGCPYSKPSGSRCGCNNSKKQSE